MQDQITTGAAGGHVPSSDDAPFAGRARELAASADALAADIRAFHEELRAADSEPVQQAGFRCGEAAGRAEVIADDLRKTADDLGRIAEASAPGTCSIPWSLCPEHGETIRSTGGRSWCSYAGCERQWDHDHGRVPCAETATWTLTSYYSDASAPVCSGHATIALRTVQGAWLTPLGSAGKRGTEAGQ